jgi:hypothetical protein
VTATLLPLPDDDVRLQTLLTAWLDGRYLESLPITRRLWPRSAWLHDFEAVLREHYPHASSRDLSLTARHAAPFPLRDGHDVP